MQVKQTRRLGQNETGTVRTDLTDGEAQWMIDRGYAVKHSPGAGGEPGRGDNRRTRRGGTSDE